MLSYTNTLKHLYRFIRLFKPTNEADENTGLTKTGPAKQELYEHFITEQKKEIQEAQAHTSTLKKVHTAIQDGHKKIPTETEIKRSKAKTKREQEIMQEVQRKWDADRRGQNK